MEEALRELLKEHETSFVTYIRIARLSKKLNTEIYNIALKKASGHKLMIDEYLRMLEPYNTK
jgi:hypothetical protein